jgi:hypothetical protein
MVLKRWTGIILTLAILAAFVGCNISILKGSGKLETRDFNITGFTGVQAGNAFKIVVSRGDAFKVQVTADDNVWDKLDIAMSGNTLHLGAKSGVIFNDVTLKADITLPVINSLDLSGAASATLNSFNSDGALAFTGSGASNIFINNVKSGSTKFELSGASTISGTITLTDAKFSVSGASRVDLNGSGTGAGISASGASRVTLDKFSVQDVTLNLSGASEARVNCKNISSADLSGASHLYYLGTPTIGKVQTSGGSAISQE